MFGLRGKEDDERPAEAKVGTAQADARAKDQVIADLRGQLAWQRRLFR
jgi:hypothetical protein